MLRALSQLALFAPLVAGASGVSRNAGLAAGKTFDYIVVGGGLTGLTVAARLAENSAVSVLVIEAGADNRNDPRVFDPYRYGDAFGSEIAWSWGTDQGRGIIGGKTLGGGSSINGMAYTRGLAAQYDSWGTLLDAGDASLEWNWANLSSYMRKSETFSPPNSQQKAKGANSVNSFHGFSGPVQVTFPDLMYGGPQQGAFQKTVTNLTGIALSADLNGGSPNCVSYIPDTINWHKGDNRSSSAEAYLTPVQSVRTNWLTLVTYQVTKITYSSTSVPVRASGVQFRATNGTGSTFAATARKEVILAAGAIQSPALLQLSGIGDPALLKSFNITSVVNLPTVGKNLQEQTMSIMGAGGNGFDEGGMGPSDIIAYPNLAQAFGAQAANATASIRAGLAGWAKSQAGNALSAAALQTIYAAQADAIVNKSAPVLEFFYNNNYPDTIGMLVWTLLPFSRGNVRIASANPLTKPAVTVNYFAVDFDLQTQVVGARLARRIFSTPPLSGLSTGETTPGLKTVPNGASGTFGSDADWRTWIKSKFVAVSHPIASCAMMSRSLGGVVDGRLRVYDTQNVRVVDASVMPLQISAHLSATLYGVAEKAADIIKAGL